MIKIQAIKVENKSDYEKACNILHELGCKADDGTGKQGHNLNGLGTMDYDYQRGVRVLVIHGNVVKKAMSDSGLKSNKFEVLTVEQFKGKK